ncbi:DUF3887 domain-containing protein [Siminovitchia sp. FSL H7-0308]|uniref:Endonuclease III-like uncharacterized protein n=1 Tax=Siminovitchia thermophila TaxID=1245522 RepID=A0ABS2R949_9BACI|nr:DUF3887 domain-containing protein [Siminovitchia thermophila]MBM7716163.1 endonuclease III-like uncharacterized protein [Siminovitchia thermophila]ONK21488.1 hypothetical protein BLX87_21785 [Bacillus sp. VT-16-64]
MKRMLFTMLSVVVMLALVACGGNKVDDATAEKYVAKAEEVVSLINEAKYKEVRAMFDETMKEKLPEDQMEELTPIIEQSGTFEKIDKSSVEEKDGLYIVIFVAKYSKDKRTFTITFNDKEEVAGLFVK